MKLIHFGRGPLVGCFHPGDLRAKTAVVLCHPGPHEYMESYWALKNLAQSLARAGLPTLRFEYFGVGDSAGESGEGRPSLWVENIVDACQEVKDQSGVNKVTLVGLRLGASLAYLASSKIKLRQLVLWEPVISGDDYINTLKRKDARFASFLLHHPPVMAVGRVEQLCGHPFSELQYEETQMIDLLSADLPKTMRVVALAQKEDEYLKNLFAKITGLIKHTKFEVLQEEGERNANLIAPKAQEFLRQLLAGDAR